MALEINAKTHASSKRCKKFEKARNYKYAGLGGHSAQKPFLNRFYLDGSDDVRVTYGKYRSLEIKMLKELGLDPLAEIPTKLNKKGAWRTLDDKISELGVVQRQWATNLPSCSTETQSELIAIEADLPSPAELRALYLHKLEAEERRRFKFKHRYYCSKRDQDKKYWSRSNMFKYIKAKKFLPHALLAECQYRNEKNKRRKYGKQNSRSEKSVLLSVPDAQVVAVSVVGAFPTRRRKQTIPSDVPRRYQISYRAPGDDKWTQVPEIFERSPDFRLEKAVEFLQNDGIRACKIKVRALDAPCRNFNFRVRVYGTLVSAKNESTAKDESTVKDGHIGSLQTGEYKSGVVLRVHRPELSDLHRQAQKQGRVSGKIYYKGEKKQYRDEMLFLSQGYNFFKKDPRYEF